jgi:threonine synthase
LYLTFDVRRYEKLNSYFKGLVCRECGEQHPETLIYACEKCFGPLEAVYNLEDLEIEKKTISARPQTIWRYHELLPVKEERFLVDLGTGYSTLHRCKGLADLLGLDKLYIKDDTVNPTNSFKDRPSAVAISKAKELGAKVVGCPSTGNLAAAVAAHAAKAGLPCYVFLPQDTELNKVLQAATYGARLIAVNGTYDETNRLAAQVAEEHSYAFANINLRPYYVEGSKTLAFEICEQLGWRAPDSIIIPMGSGALLLAIKRGFDQFKKLGLIDERPIRLIGAQAMGCAPIVDSFKAGDEDVIPIEHPDTVAKSLAIGDPGDGYYVLRAIRESNGLAESATDEEILKAIKLLARKEGIFAEPAGGVTIAVLQKLVEAGAILPNETVVCCVTGNGFKSANTIQSVVEQPKVIEPSLEAFSKINKGV